MRLLYEVLSYNLTLATPHSKITCFQLHYLSKSKSDIIARLYLIKSDGRISDQSKVRCSKTQCHSISQGIGVDFMGGSPGICPQYLRNAHAFIIFPTFCPPIFWFAFLSSLRQCPRMP